MSHIIDGVLTAQEHEQGGKGVTPWARGPIKFPESSGVSATVNAPLTIATFDVAVSAETSDSTKSGAEVQVASSAEGRLT